MDNKSNVIFRICEALGRGDRLTASGIALSEYPFVAHSNAGRKYTEYEMTRVFVRDGFVDRYSGIRLVFPGTLRLLSRLMPSEFPAHPNWKMTQCHMVFWELFPTIDHVDPIGRGGKNEETNWVTTSMLRNSAKSNWTLDELGWTLSPPGNYAEWDGLMGWFLRVVAQDQSHLTDGYTTRWHKAALRIQAG